jgi:hypothetical protein
MRQARISWDGGYGYSRVNWRAIGTEWKWRAVTPLVDLTPFRPQEANRGYFNASNRCASMHIHRVSLTAAHAVSILLASTSHVA